MLILNRRIGQTIVVPACNLTITVVQVRGKRVRLGLSAPESVKIDREEIAQRRLCHEQQTMLPDTCRAPGLPHRPR